MEKIKQKKHKETKISNNKTIIIGNNGIYFFNFKVKDII